MIKSDFRYIIKRILIGVGICIVLSLFNNNVHAMEIDYEFTDTNTNKTYSFNYNLNDTYSNYFLLLRHLNNKYIYILYGCNVPFKATSSTSMGNIIISPYTTICNNRIMVQRDFTNSDDPSYSVSYPSAGTTYSFYKSTLENAIQNLNFYNKNMLVPVILNHDIFDINNSNNVLITSNFVQVGNMYNPSSTITSLGEQLIYDDNNILTNVRFSPTYENFNISKYNYQYKIGNNNWLNITSEGATFNVNQNATIYFRILNKSNDEVVDSRTYTITQIGLYESNTDTYKVKYTSENRNINDDESLPNKLVDNVSISFEYFPKISNLKYQYQFVEENNSLGNWVDMPNNDYERTYSVTVNGTMYNRILDSNDNVLYTSTFKVNSIGTAMINSNLNWYNKLFGKVNYGKGISSIFFLPVRLLEVYKTGLESGFCNEYSFGELWGHELKMPCINVRGLVGNNIYNFIDIIGVGVISLAIINFIVSIYNGIVFMNLQDRINEDKESRLL